MVVGFGDSGGTGFGTLIGAMHCDNSGQRQVAAKTQFNGLITYGTGPRFPLTVAADGTFGSSYGPSSPSYAAVIGNNGNTLYLTTGFSADPPPDSRLVLIGLRCNDSIIPLVYHLPHKKLMPSRIRGDVAVLGDPTDDVEITDKKDLLSKYDSDYSRLKKTIDGLAEELIDFVPDLADAGSIRERSRT